MDARLSEEMAFHVDMLTARYQRAGLAPAEARRAAFVEFGGRQRFTEEARDEYRSRFLDELTGDVRYAARGLRRSPGFAIAAVATLALAIAGATSVFGIVNAVLLRSLPYPAPDRLVLVWGTDRVLQNRSQVSFTNAED